MSRWFRHYAGMMRDDKLVRAALRTKQPIERVVWVWGAILESAAEIDDAGRYDFDAAEVAYFLRAEEADIGAIEAALADAGHLASGFVVKWRDRQFQSDRSATRQAAYRQRKRGSDSGPDNLKTSRDVTVTSPSQPSDAPESIDIDREDDAVDDAQASAPKPVSEAFKLTAEILSAAKLDHEHPMAIGGQYAVQTWLNEGCPPEVILIACRRALAKKRDGPPKSFNYFREAVATEFARSKEKLPVVNLAPQGPVNGQRNVSRQEPDWDAAADRLRARLASNAEPNAVPEAAEGRIRPEPGDLDAEAIPGLGYRVQ